jgi:hypothetical protein
MKRLLVFLLVSPLLFAPAYADWDYLPKDSMIDNADAIAVVDITKVENCATRINRSSTAARTYHQKAAAVVKSTLKGKLASSITIYGNINSAGSPFICVPDASLQAGPCLVFLRDEGHDGQSFVSANADMGIRPIAHDQVQWFGANIRERKPTPLSEVLDFIRARLGKPK